MAPQVLKAPTTAPRLSFGASWLINVVAPKKALICPTPSRRNKGMDSRASGSSTKSMEL